MKINYEDKNRIKIKVKELIRINMNKNFKIQNMMLNDIIKYETIFKSEQYLTNNFDTNKH